MADIVDFSEALQMAVDQPRALLLGNGFSAGVGDFHYQSLLEKAGFPDTDPVKKLFALLNSPDFEGAVRALEAAALVETAYDHVDQAAQLVQDAQRVREALVKAVHATHPQMRDEIWASYQNGLKFLQQFNLLFTLNYDLLLYWTVMEQIGSFYDGFGLGSATSDGSFHGPFVEGAWCNMFNLHGGLHLFQDPVGEHPIGDTYKAVNTSGGVISVIANAIVHKKKLPLYVAEGTSSQKMGRINSVPYLRYCYDQLKKNTAVVFVFGHSADDNDAHIYQAIFASPVKHVFFGAYKSTPDQIDHLHGQLARYQMAARSKANITFYRSETANIWGLTPFAAPSTAAPAGGATPVSIAI